MRKIREKRLQNFQDFCCISVVLQINLCIKLRGCFRLSGITMAVKKEYNSKKLGTTDFLCFTKEDHCHSATGVWG